MRRGGRVLILLGIILGLVTAGGTFLALSTPQEQVQQVQTQPVVIALQPIPDRTEIRADQLGVQQWPEPIPVGASSRPENLVGKFALEPIYQGQIILPPMFIDKTKVNETRSNASYVIPTGKVAASFSLPDDSERGPGWRHCRSNVDSGTRGCRISKHQSYCRDHWHGRSAGDSIDAAGCLNPPDRSLGSPCFERTTTGGRRRNHICRGAPGRAGAQERERARQYPTLTAPSRRPQAGDYRTGHVAISQQAL